MTTKTLQINLDEYLQLTKAREEAEARAIQLQHDLVIARMGEPGDLIRQTLNAFRASLKITQYAMGHLSPEFARKWPRDELLAVKTGVMLLPDVTAQEKELDFIIDSFVRDIDLWEGSRNEGYRPPPVRPPKNLDEPEPPVMVSRATGSLKEVP